MIMGEEKNVGHTRYRYRCGSFVGRQREGYF